MEKYGVSITEERESLLQKEASLMSDIAKVFVPGEGTKTASADARKKENLEKELMRVRGQLSELDSYEN